MFLFIQNMFLSHFTIANTLRVILQIGENDYDIKYQNYRLTAHLKNMHMLRIIMICFGPAYDGTTIRSTQPQKNTNKWKSLCNHNPDSKVHEACMGPTWGRQDPGGTHVGPMNIAIRECMKVQKKNRHMFQRHAVPPHYLIWGEVLFLT